LEPEDVDLLYFWENNTEIWKVSSTIAPFSKFTLTNYVMEESQKDVFEARQLRLAIADSKTQKTVGLIDLFDFEPVDSRGALGIMINEKADRQKGYAKNAVALFEEYCKKILFLHQIYARTDASNKAAVALFLSCGFMQCGFLKDWHRNEDGWQDQIEFQKILE
jgi:diamine N-acetyltransferase